MAGTRRARAQWRRSLTAAAVAACLRCAVTVLVPEERGALVDIYLATNGPRWLNNFGWSLYADPKADPCKNNEEWAGVTCTADTLHLQCVPDPSRCCCRCRLVSHATDAHRLFQSKCRDRELVLSGNNLVGALPATVSVLTSMS